MLTLIMYKRVVQIPYILSLFPIERGGGVGLLYPFYFRYCVELNPCQSWFFNPVLDDKVLTMLELEAFADDNIIVA